MIPNQLHTPTFVTSSMPLAAYLIASDSLPLREIVLTDPRRGAFVFDDKDRRGPELQRKFEDGTAMVSAFKFHVQLRVLRRQVDEKTFDAQSSARQSNFNPRGTYNHVRRFQR